MDCVLPEKMDTKNGMNRSISSDYERFLHLFHGYLTMSLC